MAIVKMFGALVLVAAAECALIHHVPLKVRPCRAPTWRNNCVVAQDQPDTNAPSTSAATAQDKDMSSDVLITYDSLGEDFQELVKVALQNRDKERVLEGKPRYDTVTGMIDAYQELGAEKGWTRADAESEVVRYLQRRALQDEGGIGANGGDGQDKAAFTMIGLLLFSVVYGFGIQAGIFPQSQLQSFELPFGF